MYTCVHGLSYVWKFSINFGYFSPKLFTVLRQGLLLDSELTDLGELAGQCGPGIHPICLPSLGGQVHAGVPGF